MMVPYTCRPIMLAYKTGEKNCIWQKKMLAPSLLLQKCPEITDIFKFFLYWKMHTYYCKKNSWNCLYQHVHTDRAFCNLTSVIQLGSVAFKPFQCNPFSNQVKKFVKCWVGCFYQIEMKRSTKNLIEPYNNLIRLWFYTGLS